jgi:hypothetical protein
MDFDKQGSVSTTRLYPPATSSETFQAANLLVVGPRRLITMGATGCLAAILSIVSISIQLAPQDGGLSMTSSVRHVHEVGSGLAQQQVNGSTCLACIAGYTGQYCDSREYCLIKVKVNIIAV